MTTTQMKSLLYPAVLAALLATSSCAEEPPPPVQTPAAVAPVAESNPSFDLVPPPKAPPAEEVQARITPDADFRKEKPAAAPEREFKVPPVKRFKLKNGLAVILAESHDLPLVSFDMNIRSGGATNPKGQAGLADLTANMIDEGTKTRSALQIAEEIALLGGNLGSGANWETSSVTVSSLTKNIDKALEIWADVLLNPAFDEKEFTRVKENLLTGMTRRKDSPPQVAGLTYAKVLYGDDHPYAWPQNGTEETVKNLTTADLKKFYAKHYSPANALLAVAGDISEADLKAKLEKLLGGWKGKKVAAAKMPRTAALGKTKVYLVDKAGAPQSSIRVGLIGIERKNPDYIPAIVMNMILGGTGFHRLGLNLREGKGWTYGVSCGFDTRRAAGPWTASGEFVAPRTADSVREILNEMKKIRDEDVPDDELRAAKDFMIKAFPARFATDNQLASQMANLAILDLPDNYYDTYTKKIEAITKADVKKMAQKYLQPDKLAIVVVGDQKSNEEGLKAIADLELRDLEGKPAAVAAQSASAAAEETKKPN